MTFAKGQSGNPSGRPKEDPDVVEARKMSTAEFVRIASRYLFMTRPELVEEMTREGVTNIETVVGRLVTNAMVTGDPKVVNALLDRVIGKVPTVLDGKLAVEAGLHMQIVRAMQKIEAA
jgi:hypothetical protein